MDHKKGQYPWQKLGTDIIILLRREGIPSGS